MAPYNQDSLTTSENWSLGQIRTGCLEQDQDRGTGMERVGWSGGGGVPLNVNFQHYIGF